jgi:hypothetical protein
MTTPSIVPTKWNGTSTDFLKTKVDRSGASRAQRTTVSVPSGTTVNTIVGLVPFNKGEQITGFRLYCDALGTSVTANVGVVYDDNTNNTNNQTLFLSGSTNPAAGGELTFTTSAANSVYVTTDSGWLVATITGATTGSTGNIQGTVFAVYDGLSGLTPN